MNNNNAARLAAAAAKSAAATAKSAANAAHNALQAAKNNLTFENFANKMKSLRKDYAKATPEQQQVIVKKAVESALVVVDQLPLSPENRNEIKDIVRASTRLEDLANALAELQLELESDAKLSGMPPPPPIPQAPQHLPQKGTNNIMPPAVPAKRPAAKSSTNKAPANASTPVNPIFTQEKNQATKPQPSLLDAIKQPHKLNKVKPDQKKNVPSGLITAFETAIKDRRDKIRSSSSSSSSEGRSRSRSSSDRSDW
jgi:hypothetical protein